MSGIRMKTGLLVKGIAVVLTLIGAPAVGILMTPKREAVAQAAETHQEQAVEATKPAAAPIATGNFVGVLLPPQMANLSAFSDTRVKHIDVKLGQRVRKDQVLLGFDPREQQQMLLAAESQLQGAKARAGAAGAECGAASADARRNSGTVEWNGQKISIVSGGQADSARFNRAAACARAGAAGAEIKEAQARVDQLKLAVEHTELTAPWEGVVTAINVEADATVHAGQPVIRIVGGQGLRARIAIPEESSGVWQGRRRAQLALDDGKGGKIFWAILDQVAPEVEAASRTYFVEGPLAADNKACGGDCTLLAGRPVRATLISDNE